MLKELAQKINDQTITDQDLEKFQQHIVEMTLRTLPNTIEYLLKQTASVQQLSEDFFKRHKELQEHKDLVGQVLERTEAENPGLDYERLLDKVAVKAKSRLGSLKTIEKQPEKRARAIDMDKALGDL